MLNLVSIELMALTMLLVSLAAQAQISSSSSGGNAVATLGGAGFPSTLTTNALGTYTLANTDHGIVISGPDQTQDGINTVCKNKPATPYSAIAHFTLGVNNFPLNFSFQPPNDSGGGLAWRDSATGHIDTMFLLVNPGLGIAEPTMYAISYNTPTGPTNGSDGNQLFLPAGVRPEGWQKIVDNGTQLQMFASYDGTTWFQVTSAIAYASAGGAGFFSGSPPQVCLFVSGHGSPASITVDYYKETSP